MVVRGPVIVRLWFVRKDLKDIKRFIFVVVVIQVQSFSLTGLDIQSITYSREFKP